MSEARSDLRRELRARRRGVGDARARAARDQVAGTLAGLAELEAATRIATYLPADGELDPNGSLGRWRAGNRTVYLPRIVEDRSLRFEPWNDDTPMELNRYRMSEPAPSESALDAADLDAILVPCVAADLSGNRLGFGAGYYDRALAGAAPPTLIGILWDDAVVADLDPQPWDVPVDVIVTERRVLRPPGRRRRDD